MNYKKICILTERTFLVRKKHHVAYDTILGMEDEFVESNKAVLYNYSKVFRYLNEISYRIFKQKIPDLTLKFQNEMVYFYAAMSLYNLKINATSLKRLTKKGAKIIIYCFDTWEPQYEDWNELFSYISPAFIFLAYKQSVDYFCKKHKNVYWLPQSMNKKYFYDRNKKKTRMFMQMGRRSEKIHYSILEYLKSVNMEDTDDNYIYEKEKGKLIFPDTNELADNINSTKYFICAPQIFENEKVTGKISDVTARFYEAMACKSLILGYKPVVFEQLFPQNAMIELDAEATNLKDIVNYFENHPKEYDSIVNSNYEYVMANHTWTNRFQYICDILQRQDEVKN